MSLALINSENKIANFEKSKGWVITFPKPTVVGHKQTVKYYLRNTSKNERFEIIEVIVKEPDLKVELKGERYLFPNDDLVLIFTYNPPKERKIPLENAQVLIKAWRILEPQGR